jgi:hypothetical protein
VLRVPKDINRREFVIRSAKGVLAISATLSIGASKGNTLGGEMPPPTIPAQETGLKASADMEESKVAFLNPHQYAMVAVLADIIVPPDELAFAAQTGVADQIDAYLVQTDDNHRAAYRRGLKWMDDVSRSSYGNRFLDLESREQIDLVRRMEKMASIAFTKPRGLGARLKRKIIKTWYDVFDIMDKNVGFFIRLRKDVILAYYATPSSWNEIGYFGPPQPVGYLDYSELPNSNRYTGKMRPVENKSCLICHPKGTHPRGGLINHACQTCHRPHSPWPYAKEDFHVEDHLEMAFPNLDRGKRD